MNEEIRHKVIDHDGGKCKECGTIEDLCIHHIQSGGSDELANLITMCRSCHGKTHHPNNPNAISIRVRYNLPADVHRKMKVRAYLAGMYLKDYIVHIIKMVSEDKLVPVEGENGEDDEGNDQED